MKYVRHIRLQKNIRAEETPYFRTEKDANYRISTAAHFISNRLKIVRSQLAKYSPYSSLFRLCGRYFQISKSAEKAARSSEKQEQLAVLASQRGLEPPAPRLGVWRAAWYIVRFIICLVVLSEIVLPGYWSICIKIPVMPPRDGAFRKSN